MAEPAIAAPAPLRRALAGGRRGYHPAVTDRTTDPQVVCPFVAFDDDRDFRASVPDHRHRCFAETPAAPRALAHQAAYCLSSSFPACPTFADWARREAAPVRLDPPVRSLRDAAATPRAAAAPPATAAAPEPAPAPRRGDDDWTAPPPWSPGVAGAAGAMAAGAAEAGAASLPPNTPSDAPPGGVPPAEPTSPSAEGETPAFLAGRSSRPPAPVPAPDVPAPPAPASVPADIDPWARPPDDEVAAVVPVDRYQEPSVPVAEPRRMPVGYAPVAAGRTDHRPVAGTHSGKEHRDASAPSWEEPRRQEAYPTLKSRGSGGIPRPLVYALVVLFAGVALFTVPFILRGLGGGGEEASPSPTVAASVDPTPTPVPTAEPTPETVVYIVKPNDTLSKIAARFGVTVDEILAANPQIKNANQIAVGDEITIPPPAPDEVVDDGAITPAP